MAEQGAIGVRAVNIEGELISATRRVIQLDRPSHLEQHTGRVAPYFQGQIARCHGV